MLKIQLVLFSVLLVLGNVLNAGPERPLLAVVEENSDHVTVYNPETGKKLKSIKVGFLPHEIAITKDGKTAYVSNFGIRDYDSGSGTPGAAISVIDIPTWVEQYRLYTFDPLDYKDYSMVDSAPHGVKLRPPYENQLYVNVEKGNKVLVYDVENRTLTKKINVSPNTHNLFFSDDGKVLWLMAGKDGVIRMDPDSGEITGTVTLPTAVRGLKYTPDHRFLMASAVNQIVFIDPESLEIKKEFSALNVGPILYSDITPDQKYILAPAPFDHQVIVIDTNTGKVVKRLVTGLNPINVLISEDGQFAYIANATDKHISRVDLNTFAVSSIATHEGPNGLAFIPKLQAQSQKTLTLGVALPLSGKDNLKGREMLRGYEYWKSKVNAAGGALIHHQSYQINIIYLDTESSLDNVTTLTAELFKQYKVQGLLTTFGDEAYALESKLALANHSFITPPLGQEQPWQPDNVAVGLDYFVTTNLYAKDYLAKYNFKSSSYSAMATVVGLTLQNALIAADSLDADLINTALKDNQVHFFYSIVRS